jgi:ubiquinone/menaquinone biosynthesis C-methylase UbiE
MPKPEAGTEGGGEKKPRRVFIEIGAKRLPFPFWGKRKIGENEIYVDIDLDPQSVVSAKNLVEGYPKERGEGRHYFVRGDAKNIPLADASADEVFMGNILGEELHIGFEDKKKFISEAMRVLNKDGRLIIKETTTPLDYEKLQALLAGTGFSVEKVWDKSSRPEEFEAQRRLYEGEFDISASDSYIIVLKKNNAPGNSH